MVATEARGGARAVARMWPPSRPAASSGDMQGGTRFARTESIHVNEEGSEDDEAAVADEDDGQGTQDGDSTVATSAAPTHEVEDWAERRGGAGAAVAEAQDYIPKHSSKTRSWRRVPVIQTSLLSEKQRTIVDAWEKKTGSQAGRIGFYVANFGSTASKSTQRTDEWAQIHANPAQIIALCECDDATCAVLSGERSASDSAPAVADDKFQNRPRYNYLCVKGGEPSGTLLVGIRDRSGGCIEHVDFARLFHKREKSKPKKKKNRSAVAEVAAPRWHNKYSRAMVVRIHLDQGVEHLGSTFNVMAVHVHHSLANQAWGVQKLHEFYDWFVAYVREWEVKVCMGDFNMCMFQLVSWCRSCGLTVDVAAWTPWKTEGGQPRADSMAILFINCPGEYKLHHGLDVLHDREGGFLTTQQDPSFRVYDYTNGPGKMLQSYLPKAAPVEDKMRAFLTPSDDSVAAVADFERRMAHKGPRVWVPHPFRVRQRILDDKIWHGAFGNARNGAHFPLAAFTHNTARRSPEKTAVRAEKQAELRKAKGGKEGGSNGGKKGGDTDTAVAGKGAQTQMGTSIAPTTSYAAVAAGSCGASGSGARSERWPVKVDPATGWQDWSELWSTGGGADGGQHSDRAAVADNAAEGSPPQWGEWADWGSTHSAAVADNAAWGEWGSTHSAGSYVRSAERAPWSFSSQRW